MKAAVATVTIFAIHDIHILLGTQQELYKHDHCSFIFMASMLVIWILVTAEYKMLLNKSYSKYNVTLTSI